MTETIFEFLHRVGFTHPVHPALTHIPMGMVMGAVTFRILAFIPKLRFLAKTAYHCVILGLLGIAPTVFAGYLDWQHTYGGEWEFLIILKMVLAGLLAILMITIAVTDKQDEIKLDRKTVLYLVLVVVAIGLGYSGGELQYG